MNDKSSKKIKKTDDSAKEFIIKCLKDNPTYGFDIDSIYYLNNQYYIFEYLKCENEYVSPHTSHPRRYPYNWRKFYSLWEITNKLGGFLFLVNYSDRSADKNLVKLIYVKDFKYEKLDELDGCKKGSKIDFLETEEFDLTDDEFSEYLINLNNSASLPKHSSPFLPKKIGGMRNE